MKNNIYDIYPLENETDIEDRKKFLRSLAQEIARASNYMNVPQKEKLESGLRISNLLDEYYLLVDYAPHSYMYMMD